MYTVSQLTLAPLIIFLFSFTKRCFRQKCYGGEHTVLLPISTCHDLTSQNN